jgi:hypothetical protein
VSGDGDLGGDFTEDGTLALDGGWDQQVAQTFMPGLPAAGTGAPQQPAGPQLSFGLLPTLAQEISLVATWMTTQPQGLPMLTALLNHAVGD